MTEFPSFCYICGRVGSRGFYWYGGDVFICKRKSACAGRRAAREQQRKALTASSGRRSWRSLGEAGRPRSFSSRDGGGEWRV